MSGLLFNRGVVCRISTVVGGVLVLCCVVRIGALVVVSLMGTSSMG